MKTQEEWTDIYSLATHGDTLWDGTDLDPKNPKHAYRKSHETVNLLTKYGFFNQSSRVLDLGCGNGKLAIALTELPIKCYVGIDIIPECIEFCKLAFFDYPNYAFKAYDIYNKVFNPNGLILPTNFKLPFANNSIDNVVFHSVSMNLEFKEVAVNYIEEIRRVLKINGKLYSTWFRHPPNPVSYEAERTIYEECDILSMLSGMKFDYTNGGNSPSFFDQWHIINTKI